jgi:hypothetical protein
LKSLPFFIVITVSALTFQVKGQTLWRVLETPPFQIRYAASEQIYAEELATLLQVNYESLSAQLHLALTEPVTVYFVSSQDDFDNLTGNAIPHWGEGIADPMRNLIVLKSPGMTDNHSRFPKLIRHELVHILIGQSVPEPQTLPKWFNEGMALIYARDAEFARGTAISRALLTDEMIPLDEIEHVLKFQQVKARLAYEQSYAFTAFLIEEYGERKLLDLLKRVMTGISFEQVFTDVYGMDQFDMELLWFEYLQKKYRWRFLEEFETFLWILMPVLVILAVIIMRVRNRKTMQRWENEDRYRGA